MVAVNTQMVIVRSPMGRDMAAFAYPNDAWDYLSDMPGKENISFVRPIDGKSESYSDFSDYSEFLNWVVNA